MPFQCETNHHNPHGNDAKLRQAPSAATAETPRRLPLQPRIDASTALGVHNGALTLADVIFGKKSTNTTSAPTPEPIIEPTAPVGKGRPTPKRAQSQAKNVRPLVPGDRRAAAKAAREQERSLRNRAYQGMQRGEERYLPARDKGPQKRFIRDYVDARWNLGEFFLPVAMLFIVAQFFVMQYPALAFTVIIALYAIVLIAVIDAAILWLRLRKALIAKFGEVQKGSVMYTIMRAFQLRMSRLPKPIHKKHGHYPN